MKKLTPRASPPRSHMIHRTMTDDAELLREFFRTRDEGPLRVLMDRHLPLVYSVALRISGNPELAAEIAQDVFLKLIHSPTLMKKGTPLLAWLHRSTRHRAIDALRSEQARKRRERLVMENAGHSEDTLSAEALAALDDVLDQLPTKDRDLVLERYFAGRSLKAIGSSLGLSEDAVRMRLVRTLEKMRAAFSKRGIAASAALLAFSLPLQAVVVPPPALCAGIRSAVTAAAGAAPPASLAFHLTAMSSTQKILAAAALLLVVGTAGSVFLQWDAPPAPATGPRLASSTLSSPSGRSARSTPTSTALTTGETARLERVQKWLKDTSPEAENEEMLQQMAVNRLGLGSVRLLLSDPALIEDVQGPHKEDDFPNPIFPRRELLGRFLWKQFGKLAPRDALDHLLAVEAPPQGSFQHTLATLDGVAKTDPALALQFLSHLPAGIGEDALLSSWEDLMPSLVKHSPNETFNAILALPVIAQGEAYLAYLRALPQGSDWSAETARLGRDLPRLRGAAGTLAGSWACSDPDAAFAWLATANKDPDFGYFDAVRTWMYREPSGAIKWLGTWNPDNVNRDRLYAKIFISGGPDDIRVVDGLLGLISNPSIRTDAVKKSIKNMGGWTMEENLLHLQASPLLGDEARRSIADALAAKKDRAAAK